MPVKLSKLGIVRGCLYEKRGDNKWEVVIAISYFLNNNYGKLIIISYK